MRIFSIIILILFCTELSFAEKISTKKVIETALDSLFEKPEMKYIFSKDDTVLVYMAKNYGHEFIENKINSVYKQVKFYEIFKDQIIKKKLIILDNKPITISTITDSLHPDLIIRNIKIYLKYQLFEGYETPVFEYNFDKIDTINTNDLNYNQVIEIDKKTEKAEVPSFYQRFVEPTIVYTSSLAIILLLFFVRS
jgi:hypothetical protein